MVCAGMKVIPTFGVARQVDSSLPLTRVDHVRNEQLRSEHEIVAVRVRARVVLEVVEEWAKNRFAQLRGATIQRVQIRHQSITKTNRRADRLQRFRMKPRRIGFAARLPRVHDEAWTE